MSLGSYDKNVFVNCPFDEDYEQFFHALLFTIFDCGFVPRCTREEDDGSETRIQKIQRLINESHYGVHDISRTELDKSHNLPRFNMPFELGLFLGARHFGPDPHSRKNCLILEAIPYQYQKYISDIGGQDPRCHEGDVLKMIKVVRNWLSSSIVGTTTPGHLVITQHYVEFMKQLPLLCAKVGLDQNDIPYNDFIYMVGKWLSANA